MKHVSKQMQYRFAAIYETPSISQIPFYFIFKALISLEYKLALQSVLILLTLYRLRKDVNNSMYIVFIALDL